MSIKRFAINFPGQSNEVTPRIGHLYAPNDTLSTISSAGYLDTYIQSQNFSVLPTDVIIAVGSNGAQWYQPVFSAGVCTLTVLPG
jgi:hypothetical protein